MNERSFENFCKRLANHARFDVLRQVARALPDEGVTVNAIADQVRLKQSATSQYLAQLEGECGLVRSERQGRYVVYRFAADPSFAPAVQLGDAIYKYLRKEAAEHHFLNHQLADPPFIAVFEALGNADRGRVAAFAREQGKVDKPMVMAALKLTELNVRRHLAKLCELGLLEPGLTSYRWNEPRDAISRLALGSIPAANQPSQISDSHSSFPSHITISDGSGGFSKHKGEVK